MRCKVLPHLLALIGTTKTKTKTFELSKCFQMVRDINSLSYMVSNLLYILVCMKITTDMLLSTLIIGYMNSMYAQIPGYSVSSDIRCLVQYSIRMRMKSRSCMLIAKVILKTQVRCSSLSWFITNI